MSIFENLIRKSTGLNSEKLVGSIWDEKGIRLPLISIFLSFLFPPIGCITFLIMSRAPKSSPKYKISIIALYFGSLLSVVYTFLIAMFLLTTTGPKRASYVHTGAAY
ncbi:hypothetical protein [Cryptosporidium parvum Iowa II]|uniref:Uncharacterized protein n=2 Tax=Cryptosporidium parvum TaxID=5807 RepID=Q5CY19_CRYPI|nr:hypothetical protein [Cryptosporidium parvum Iowa II]EAK90197.1 hypothetical protein cgd7_4040 [Cryptosporidium parvum Iowa II]QOY40725.1 Uncharacterized protein CPATCC_0009890 [Cryptosporidium parvum]WKS79094.1 hypothetical protein CPCDC_7g4040 [Cryptosporidium sp. 43IA8]WRK33581.1 Uncharacterized protein cpbgf_7004040 [Cryptosporidium parvum]|eukprot:QOY40725.1 hypothetical protein CPATCC_003614 [Cryptosporidium parvum]